MTQRRHFLRCMLSGSKSAITLLLLTGLRAFAQVSTANVIGVVQDFSSAVVPAAQIKLINTQTGAENDSMTGDDGRFILPGVLPGAYTLQIERSGFSTTQLDDIVLNIGDTRNFLVRLKIGPVTESVVVDASGLSLNTSDATVSTVVDRRFVSTIPLNGRSFQDLISMTPGIVTQSPQAANHGAGVQGDFSVNGQPTDANSFYVDGISANRNLGFRQNGTTVATTGSTAGSTALGTTQSLVSVDALQEFRVLSSTYSAEYGGTPGGQFTFLTRSGTSDYHGSLYSYWRGNVYDAPDWFAAYLGAADQHRDFTQDDSGGTLSGPLRMPRTRYGLDKTFGFLSFERLNLTQQVTPAVDFVPSAAVDEAVLANPFLAYFPLGGDELADASGKPGGLSTLVVGNGDSFPAHLSATNLRLDHNFSPRVAVFLRYGDTPSNSQIEELSSITQDRVRTRTVTLGTMSQLTPKITDEFRFGFSTSRSSTSTAPQLFDVFPSVPTFNSSLGIPPNTGSASAEAFIHIAGIGDSAVLTDKASSSIDQWSTRDSLTIEAAKHLLKFGFDQRHIATTITPASLAVQADFLSRSAMIDGVASNVAISRTQPASPVLNQFSAFAQDEWRMSKEVTLSFGLRWDVSLPPHGVHGLDAYTALGDVTAPATLTIAPRGTPLWHTGWFNFAPRFGAAWMIDPNPGRELILRAGGGVFFDTEQRPALRAFTQAGFRQTSLFENAQVPVSPAQLQFPDDPSFAFAHATVFAFPVHLQLPYSLQWNVALEKSFGKTQALTISYVGSNGARLMQEQRRDIRSFNPAFGDLSFFPPGITSNYQSLQTKFQRSFSRGVQALVSYTWAHSLDYGSTDPAYPLTYGNSDLDVRHNLEAALSCDLPQPHGGTLTRHLLENWGLDGRLIARTAFPITLFGNLVTDPVTGERYFSGVDKVPNRSLYLDRTQYPGGRIINGGPMAIDPAFVLPVGAYGGDAPRNLVRGFSAVQTNISIRRNIPLHDRLAMQLRAETFNLLNHPNFGYVDPVLPDLLFGQSTRMLNQSFGPSGSLYQQGGPRSIQLSFRMVF